MFDYAIVGVSAAVFAAVILAWPALDPSIRRRRWLVGLAIVVAVACVVVYRVHHMWDGLDGVRLGPPVR